MKKYDQRMNHGIAAMRENADGEWVPASVAQALYDALKRAELWTDEEYDVGEWREQALAALSLADGEE